MCQHEEQASEGDGRRLAVAAVKSKPSRAPIRHKSLRYKAEPVGLTSLWSVVSSVNVKVFEDDVLLG